MIRLAIETTHRLQPAAFLGGERLAGVWRGRGNFFRAHMEHMQEVIEEYGFFSFDERKYQHLRKNGFVFDQDSPAVPVQSNRHVVKSSQLLTNSVVKILADAPLLASADVEKLFLQLPSRDGSGENIRDRLEKMDIFPATC